MKRKQIPNSKISFLKLKDNDLMVEVTKPFAQKY